MAVFELQAWATSLFFLSLGFSAVLLCLPSRHTPDPAKKPRVVVLVLGDIGRSPRMQNHALSLAAKGAHVDLVAYHDTDPRPELLSHPLIHLHALSAPPRWMDTSTAVRFLIFAPFKAVFQLCSLFRLLCYCLPADASHILVQNPPAIPTLLVATAVSRLRRQKLIVDWHNFGYSIMALKLKQHPMVLVAKLYEIFFSWFAHANFTVTHSMQNHLRTSWRITAPIATLYDRPAAHFQPLHPLERLAFLRAHPATAPYAAALAAGTTKLLISQTSWTADEDFSALIEALVEYDRVASTQNFLAASKGGGGMPDILAIITGRGPLRDGYMAQIEKLEFAGIAVASVWLSAEEYPKMIGCADLGVSLHKSSSGLDLPMKVVDLFGCGVPVVAMKFRAVAELVKQGENGAWFEEGKELGAVLQRLLAPEGKELERLKEGAVRETERRWEGEWEKVAAPVFGL